MKKHFLLKIFSISFLAISLLIMPIRTPEANALWGEMPAQILGNSLATMRAQILGMIMGSLKQAAIQAISSKISGIVGGSSSQNSKIIGNYTDFLHTAPQNKTNLYMNDYLSQITQGRGSNSSYIPNNEGFGNGAFVGGLTNDNYKAQLVVSAKAVTNERTEANATYIGNPSQNMFSAGNMDNFNLYLSGINNPWAFNLNAEQKYQERLTIEQDAARTEAIAGRGFKSTQQGGTITTPGSLTADIMASAQTVGLNSLANAQSVPEVITAVVQGIISKTIQNGVGNAQGNAQKSQNVTNSAAQNTNTQAQTDGPAAAWKNPDLAN